MHMWTSNILLALELLATAAFALSGVIEATRKRMDVFGVCVVGFLTAFGGGTLRDVLMDRRPFFWVEHQYALVGVLLLCVVAMSVMRLRHLEQTARTIQWPDAMGLGLFCATGVHQAWSLGMPYLVAIMMGVIAATFGGVLRDLICNEVPVLFRDHRPYALCAIAGGVGYGLVQVTPADDWLAIAVCVVVTTGLRVLTLWRDWRLPQWRG